MNELKTIFETNKHRYSIKLRTIDSRYMFEINARDKSSNTKSTITNVNWVLSELIVPIVQLESYETTIYANKNTCAMLYSKAVELFNDKEWTDYLEKELEKDKECGEWE